MYNIHNQHSTLNVKVVVNAQKWTEDVNCTTSHFV